MADIAEPNLGIEQRVVVQNTGRMLPCELFSDYLSQGWTVKQLVGTSLPSGVGGNMVENSYYSCWVIVLLERPRRKPKEVEA